MKYNLIPYRNSRTSIMFGLFKFIKLNGILHDCNILSGFTNRINIDIVDQNRRLFDMTTEKGREQFVRLVQIFYENYPAASRMKLLIMIHRLITRQASIAQCFLQQPKREFEGVKIVKRLNKSISKRNDMSTRSPDASISSQVNRSRTTSRHSVDEEILFDDVNVYLHMYLVQPYYNYLMKLCAHYDLYEQCKHYTKGEQQPNYILLWKIINLIKSLTPIRSVLTHIGRYYLPDNVYIVDFLQAITRDINYFYRVIEINISVAFEKFTKSDKLSMENILQLIDEMVELNEALFEIYYSRYFYKMIQHVKSPKWVTLTNEQIEMMSKFYQVRFGEGKAKRKNATVTLSHTREKERSVRNFEDMNMSFGAV